MKLATLERARGISSLNSVIFSRRTYFWKSTSMPPLTSLNPLGTFSSAGFEWGWKGLGKSNLCRQLSKHILNMEITSSLAPSLSLLSPLLSDTSWAVVLSPEINSWIVSSPWDDVEVRSNWKQIRKFLPKIASVFENETAIGCLANDKWEGVRKGRHKEASRNNIYSEFLV